MAHNKTGKLERQALLCLSWHFPGEEALIDFGNTSFPIQGTVPVSGVESGYADLMLLYEFDVFPTCSLSKL